MMNGYILVEPIIVDEVGIKVKGKKSEVKLAKPQSYDDKAMEGIIVNCPKARRLDDGSIIAMVAEMGDHVTFNGYSADKRRWDGIDFLYIHEEDIYETL